MSSYVGVTDIPSTKLVDSHNPRSNCATTIRSALRLLYTRRYVTTLQRRRETLLSGLTQRAIRAKRSHESKSAYITGKFRSTGAFPSWAGARDDALGWRFRSARNDWLYRIPQNWTMSEIGWSRFTEVRGTRFADQKKKLWKLGYLPGRTTTF